MLRYLFLSKLFCVKKCALVSLPSVSNPADSSTVPYNISSLHHILSLQSSRFFYRSLQYIIVTPRTVPPIQQILLPFLTIHHRYTTYCLSNPADSSTVPYNTSSLHRVLSLQTSRFFYRSLQYIIVTPRTVSPNQQALCSKEEVNIFSIPLPHEFI